MVELSSDEIEEAMDHCDSFESKSAFLSKYGFGTPREFWVERRSNFENSPYPAKAIAAVALGWSDINGGYSQRDSACNVLERAGYRIVDKNGKAPSLSVSTLVDIFQTHLQEIGATEGIMLARYRIGQQVFRRGLLAQWEGRCSASGLSDISLLRASHIKGWADCETDAERLDPDNGLLLSALWDAAFDQGLVTFTDDGSPLAASSLSSAAYAALNLDSVSPIPLSPGRKVYLEWHRKNRFQQVVDYVEPLDRVAEK